MYFTSILAVTDFSVDGDHAVERAAQLAVSHGATLKLLYAPMSSNPARADAATRIAHSAREVSNRLGLLVHPVDAIATTPGQVAKHARGADLLVIPYSRERTLKTLIWGQPAIHVARRLDCPILVTQRATWKRFKRILVAVDFTPPSRNIVMMACAVEKDAQVQMFHAVNIAGESRLRQADVSLEAIRSYRESRAHDAQVRMSELTESLGAISTNMLSALGRGDPARQAVVRQEYVGADLLVVGKRQRMVCEDLLLGSTAHRVLRHATCDVLVVPHGFQASTRTAARQRIRAGDGAANEAWGGAQESRP